MHGAALTLVHILCYTHAGMNYSKEVWGLYHMFNPKRTPVRRPGRSPASSMAAVSLLRTAGASSAVVRHRPRASRTPRSSATCAGSARASLWRRQQQAAGLPRADQVPTRRSLCSCGTEDAKKAGPHVRHVWRIPRRHVTICMAELLRVLDCGNVSRDNGYMRGLKYSAAPF